MIPVSALREIVAAFRDAAATVASWRVELDRIMIRVQAVTGREQPELRTAAIRAGRRLGLSPAAVADWMVDMLAVGVDPATVAELCDRAKFKHDVYGNPIPPPWERA